MELPPSNIPTLADLGLTKRESSEAQFLATLPNEDFEKVKSGKQKLSTLKRESKREEDAKAIRSKNRLSANWQVESIQELLAQWFLYFV